MTAPETARFTVRQAASPAELLRAFEIRRRVFVGEQNVPKEEEFDSDDAAAIHVVAWLGSEAVATGRLVVHRDHGRIGRMAVLAAHRRRGAGRAVLEELMRLARLHGIDRLVLHAQVHAVAFYERAGFRAVGEPFEEAGILHCRMVRQENAS